MNIKTTLALYAEAAGGQSTGSSLVPSDLPQQEKDLIRQRLVKTNPDVDAAKLNEVPQTDSAGFVGKKYIVQDTQPYGYGHYISEHDDSSSASLAEQARPGSRVLHAPDWHNDPAVRKLAQKKAAKTNPDVD